MASAWLESVSLPVHVEASIALPRPFTPGAHDHTVTREAESPLDQDVAIRIETALVCVASTSGNYLATALYCRLRASIMQRAGYDDYDCTSS
eukprot:3641756-Pleurochrysis_carterae.AAC.3